MIMEIYLDELTAPVQDDFSFNYNTIETLASGSFGTVIRAIHLETNREVAVKVISKEREKISSIHKLKQEVNILKQLKHQNIVEFLGFIDTKCKLYIIMEYIPQGTLKSLIEKRKGTFTEEEASKIIGCLLSAVDYLHCREICHRDIKPENIMFQDTADFSTLKLVDFGLSAQYFEELEEFDFCGTLLYMAPEQIEKKNYSKAIDIWSVGMIMFMLLNHGRHPFYSLGDSKAQYIDKIKNSKLILFNKCSEMARILIMKLLDPNPSSRYTSEKALKHPWVTRRIYDNIPITFFETLRNNQILRKMKGLIGAILFLSNHSQWKKLFHGCNIPQEYINKLVAYSMLKKEKFVRNRERSFDIIHAEDNTPPPTAKVDTERNKNINPQSPTKISNLFFDDKDNVDIVINRRVYPGSNANSPKIHHRGKLIKQNLKIKITQDDKQNGGCKNGNISNNRSQEKFPPVESPENNKASCSPRASIKAVSVSPVGHSRAFTNGGFKIDLKKIDKTINSPDSVGKCSGVQFKFSSRLGCGSNVSNSKIINQIEFPLQKKLTQVPYTKEKSLSYASNGNGDNISIPLILPNIHSPYHMKRKKKDYQVVTGLL